MKLTFQRAVDISRFTEYHVFQKNGWQVEVKKSLTENTYKIKRQYTSAVHQM